MSERLEQIQVTAITACLLWGGMSLFIAVGNSLGHDIWLATLTAAALTLLLAFAAGKWLPVVAMRLSERSGSKLIATLGLLYALLYAAAVAFSVTELWRAWNMPLLPISVYMPLLLLVMLYGGYVCGYVAAARMAVLSVLLLLTVELADTLLLLPAMQWRRLLQPAEAAAGELLLLGGRQFLILLCGIPLLPFLLAHADIDIARRGIRRGMMLAVCYALLLEIRNVLLLGDLIMLEQYPFLRSLKMVTVDIGLNRMEYAGILSLLAVAVNAGMLSFSVARLCSGHIFGSTQKI